jgi:hypothetical protein
MPEARHPSAHKTCDRDGGWPMEGRSGGNRKSRLHSIGASVAESPLLWNERLVYFCGRLSASAFRVAGRRNYKR